MSDGVYIRQGKSSTLNITAAQVVASVPKDFAIGQCRLVRVNVLVAGTAGGAAYDAATTATAAAANQIGAWPNTVGSYLIDMPCLNGIVIVPGAGQTVSVSYD
ncbi:hypothetical protein 8G_00011 [Ralstonia phage Hyacinthe]|uniref:Uncharacterized protein n=3 Tax=Rahariannevirus raharianne TaxID=2846050 RepID=A0A7G5BBC6_9CAUD|nr:hypothetical protein KMC43_gp30 [Ralstonia phage Raharianne]QMV32405.1 hypothetical protein U2_00030 [Ralstonia phage Albius]QMV33443.1 hypothetical protein 8G_00011 [Ralstonia phage Hyacinthe]QMV33599.1 hypothetical protein Y2_00030 [Ralstonia phage Raharianne]